jgi:NADP-dependent alcohol dehydrogenase
MQNFIFQNPVKIYFGAGQIAALPQELTNKHRILLTYGQGSIKSNGIYDQVMTALKGCTVIEFAGIEPNPSYETLMRAVEIVRKEKIDFLLAVGGGSVIDGTKFIAAAAVFPGEPWDILAKHTPLTKALPIGAVLTLPAAGSEMNCGAVINRTSTKDKFAFMDAMVFPKFAILDPQVIATLPARQIANGIVDTYIHVLEQYLTYPADGPFQERYAEAVLQTVLEEGPKVLANPKDYAACANFMWCAAVALNHTISVGMPEDWTTHTLGHEVTALFGLDHGQTLAAIMPAVMQVCRKDKHAKLLQYAQRVFGVQAGGEEERIDAAIEKTRSFFKSLGVKVKLGDYGLPTTAIDDLVEQLRRHGFIALGERGKVDLDTSRKIYEQSW